MKEYKGVWIPNESTDFYHNMDDGIYNKPLFDDSMACVKNWEVALDLGSHIGTWSKALCGKFKYVYGFEFVEKVIECCDKNLVSNRFALVKRPVAHCGVDVRLCQTASTLGNHVGIGGDRVCIAVDEIKYPGKVGFIKMNIEGAEPLALMGAVLTIMKDKPVITLEYKYETKFGFDSGFCQKFLELLGYKKHKNVKVSDIYTYG